MTYLYIKKNRAESKKGKFLSLSALFVFSLLVFYYARSPMSLIALRIITPVQSIAHNYISNTYLGLNFLKPKGEIISEKEALKERVQDLENLLVDVEVMRYENNLLREITEVDRDEYLIAGVTLSYPGLPFDTVVIDKGIEDGVRVGAPVLHSDYVALGNVEESQNTFSKVRLFSSPGIVTESFVLRTGEGLTIEGAGGGSFLFKAPKEFDLQEGDIIVLPGLDKRVIAEVISIIEEGDSSFRTVLMRPPVNINKDSHVLIIR